MTLRTTRFEVRRYQPAAIHHAHDHHQIVFPLRGTLAMDVDGRACDVTGLCAAAIPAGQEHGFAGSSDNAFLVVDVPSPAGGVAEDAALWSAVGDRPFVSFGQDLRGFCETVMRDSRVLAGNGVRSEIAGAILVEALERAIGVDGSGAVASLARATAFIEAHLDTALPVRAIARHAGVSESALYALFDAHFRMPPKRFVAQRRMERAALLLSETRLPVAEIAQRVGYGDQSAFTRAFRRFFGETPAAYCRAKIQDRHKTP